MPLPEPEAALFRTTQLGLPKTDHAQPAGAVMVMVALPPADENTCPPALRVYVQTTGAAWFTVTVALPIVSAALRSALVLAATTSVMLAGPVPEDVLP